jgi:hypothetical protein
VNVSIPEQKMEVIGKQDPGITTDLRLQDNLFQTGQEVLIILTVHEDPGTLGSPHDHMLKQSGRVKSWLARHEGYWVIGIA